MNKFYKHDLMMLPRYTSKCRELFTFKAVSIMHVTLHRQSWCQWINNESGSATGLGLTGEAEGHFPALGALCLWRPSLVWDLLRLDEVQSWPKTMEPPTRSALAKPCCTWPCCMTPLTSTEISATQAYLTSNKSRH